MQRKNAKIMIKLRVLVFFSFDKCAIVSMKKHSQAWQQRMPQRCADIPHNRVKANKAQGYSG